VLGENKKIDWWWFGRVIHEQKKWTITMTNEHHLVLKEDTNRKQNNG
jgi:hypothetical protein